LKRVVLKGRGARRRPLRSDTLHGLLAWGVREVYGPAAVARFLGAGGSGDLDSDAAPALVLTSTFPCSAQRSWFPRPLGEESAWMDDAELLSRVAGVPPASSPDPSLAPDEGADLFFLAYGRHEPMLEAALLYLERAGFGGNAATGESAYEVEIQETEFVRPAKVGETGLLLSLWSPSDAERAALVEASADRDDVRWEVERRQGVAGGRRMPLARPIKRAVAMIREGSVVPVVGLGQSPVVGRIEAEGDAFDVRQPGHGFFVPLATTVAGSVT